MRDDSPQVVVVTYVSTSNGYVTLKNASGTQWSVAYNTFTDYRNGGYGIFDDDGTGKQATTTDRQNRTVNVGNITNYSGDNFAKSYIVTRIQANGTVTICDYENSFIRFDNPPMITTTGSEIGVY